MTNEWTDPVILATRAAVWEYQQRKAERKRHPLLSQVPEIPWCPLDTRWKNFDRKFITFEELERAQA